MGNTLVRIAALVAAAVTVAAGCGEAPEGPGTYTAPQVSTPALEVGVPKRISIPKIKVNEPIIPVGLDEHGELAVPYTKVGWYEQTARPGEDDPAVIAAHVDTKKGPDVFYRLNRLRPGDEVIITDSRGAEFVFIVQKLMMTPKDELPAEEIFGETSRPEIRLITCGGPFDADSGHYTENVTVFAAVR